MQMALDLAALGSYSTSPNPRVGAVIVKDNQVIGTGYHQVCGEAHAEINAINAARSAGFSVAGATIYINLEPCAHHGRTPACAKALLEAQIGEVVIAMLDPNQQVAGKGVALLQAAGTKVRIGLLAEAAYELNRGFISNMSRGRPWLQLKTASSLDAKNAMADGSSKWITGPEARADVHSWRLLADAIITGSGTVNIDNPRLDARHSPNAAYANRGGVPISQQPLCVVLANHLNISASSQLFAFDRRVLLVCSQAANVADFEQQLKLCGARAEVEIWQQSTPSIDLSALLQELGARGCNYAFLEAGAKLLTGFWRQDLIDEWLCYIAPKVMGSSARAVIEVDYPSLAEARQLRLLESCQLGADLRLRYAMRAPDYLHNLCQGAIKV